jgi:hypothetical protein
MAGEAFGRLGFGIGDLFTKDKDADTSFTAFFHMGSSRAVTGLASFLIRRAVGDAFFGMGRYGVSVVVVFMTTFTDLHSHSAITPTYLLGP